ncbi:MAG: hypothetical protein R8F63_02655 [Acidimicrobiales bacterium]|nr:hypothetical protein [Acidimicrobiales bacterium]
MRPPSLGRDSAHQTASPSVRTSLMPTAPSTSDAAVIGDDQAP